MSLDTSSAPHQSELPTFAALIQRATEFLFRVISWACLLMALLTFLIVVLRYGFSSGWIALQESVMYLHAAVFMLGIPYTLAIDGHVRVDVFYRNFSAVGKARVNFFGTLLLLFPVSGFVLWFSLPYVSESWRLLESSKEAGGLPLVFVLKSLIPACMVLLILQGIAELARNWPQLQNKGA